MAIRSYQAWLIHKYWSGDSSARVYFFTAESGLLSCLCRGARAPKKQALLQAFTPLWISIDERYDHHYAQSIESCSPMLSLVGHALFSALYVNELIYSSLKPLYPDPELFRAYLVTVNSLALLDDRLAIEALLRRFEWSLLSACGHDFSMTHEARSGQLIEANSYYHFIAGEGFSVAKSGIPGEYLLALAEDDLNDVVVLKAAKIIMRQAIDHLLGGKKIKARSLYS